MRRRTKESAATAPPLPLVRYRGSTAREALAWLRERDEWWNSTHDVDDAASGSREWLPWLLDGHEQIGDLAWCGSVDAPCGDDDCLCVVWPEHLAPQEVSS